MPLTIDVAGEIADDVLWDDTSVAYLLIGDVTVSDGGSLTVAEGVSVTVSIDSNDLFLGTAGR